MGPTSQLVASCTLFYNKIRAKTTAFSQVLQHICWYIPLQHIHCAICKMDWNRQSYWTGWTVQKSVRKLCICIPVICIVLKFPAWYCAYLYWLQLTVVFPSLCVSKCLLKFKFKITLFVCVKNCCFGTLQVRWGQGCGGADNKQAVQAWTSCSAQCAQSTPTCICNLPQSETQIEKSWQGATTRKWKPS